MTEIVREPSEVATAVIRQLQVAVPKMRAADLNSRLKEDLGMSSLSLVSTLAKLSASMGVDMLEFTDSDLARLSSVGDLIRLFERERSKQ
jgi:acyl carrier protein